MRRLTYIGLVDRWRVQHRHPTKQGGGALTGCGTAGYGGGWRRVAATAARQEEGRLWQGGKRLFGQQQQSQARKAKWLSRPRRHRRRATRRRHQDCNL